MIRIRSLKNISQCVGILTRQSSPHVKDTKIILQIIQPCISHTLATKQLHQSCVRLSDDSDNKPQRKDGIKSAAVRNKRTGGQHAKKSDVPIDPEMKQAVVNAAKSLPGNWTRTADQLLSRLQEMEGADGKEVAKEADKESDNGSLLSTMKVGRAFDATVQGKRRDTRGRNGRERSGRRMDDDSIYSQSVTDKVETRKRLPRRTETFTELNTTRRLNIFDAEKVKKQVSEQQPSDDKELDMWHKLDLENMKKAQGAVPRNGFEEMIQWTKEGKLWQFPVDNEEGLDEERNYKFHEHIFLEHHLTEFPDKGPVRKFMELVCLGLSKNPWLSVPEKVEHIRWFAQYFREKQDALQASLGEQGLMKEGEGKIEA